MVAAAAPARTTAPWSEGLEEEVAEVWVFCYLSDQSQVTNARGVTVNVTALPEFQSLNVALSISIESHSESVTKTTSSDDTCNLSHFDLAVT